MRPLAFLILVPYCCAAGAFAQLAAPPPQLDFLAGSWALHDPSGTRVGSSRIVVQASNAMLFEERQVGNAAMQPLWFANVESSGRWTQYFVGALGLIRAFVAESGPGAWPIVMGADVTLRDGTPVRFRMTMSRASADETRRILEISRDGGAAWSTVFDYVYRREAASN
jgi:hypothetical protein